MTHGPKYFIIVYRHSIFICIPKRQLESKYSNFCNTLWKMKSEGLIFLSASLKNLSEGSKFCHLFEDKIWTPLLKNLPSLEGVPQHTPLPTGQTPIVVIFCWYFYLSTTHKDSCFYSLNPSRPGDLKEAFNVCELDEESQVCCKIS